jgi:hygromycin-B 7''-O-kinase
MVAVLPEVEGAPAFYALLRRPGTWDEAIATIRDRHRLGGDFSQSDHGSTVVFLSERWCIKLHPPVADFPATERREAAALECVAGQMSIATPRIEARSELEGWPYIVMTRVRGVPIDMLWPELDTTARVALAAQLGAAIRSLHALDPAPLANVTEPWTKFRPAQRARCLDLERSEGLPASRIAEVDAYLRRFDSLDDTGAPRVVLHTELGPNHVLIDGDRVSGLIDFADAMVGDPEYDFAPVGLFITRGDRVAFGALCRAYGFSADYLADPTRPHRLLRHALLHRYGTLSWFQDYLSPPDGSLYDLAEHWFGAAH